MYQNNGCIKKREEQLLFFWHYFHVSDTFCRNSNYCRITAADRRVQSALNTSARSVLAEYESELIGNYGIYGVNAAGANVKEDFYRYMSVNLKERHENINFIEIDIDFEDIQIQGMDSLLKHEAFKRQVQEYMKYRTPIKSADTLIEQLQDIKLDKKINFINR